MKRTFTRYPSAGPAADQDKNIDCVNPRMYKGGGGGGGSLRYELVWWLIIFFYFTETSNHLNGNVNLASIREDPQLLSREHYMQGTISVIENACIYHETY